MRNLYFVPRVYYQIRRIKVKNIPLSADDGQIHRTLTLEGCNIEGIFREKLRVDGRLTNCDTGDRRFSSSSPSCTLMFGSGKTRS
jgi:hypothetical protein